MKGATGYGQVRRSVKDKEGKAGIKSEFTIRGRWFGRRLPLSRGVESSLDFSGTLWLETIQLFAVC